LSTTPRDSILSTGRLNAEKERHPAVPKASRQAITADSILMPVPVNENTERIFAQAWAMFQQYGFRGTSLDELCHRCDLTKPTLYHYFGNKEMLYVHVMLRQLQGYRAVLEAAHHLRRRLADLAEAILGAFDTDINSMMRDMEHVEDARLHEVMAQAFRRELFEPLARALGQDMPAATQSGGQAEFYAWVFLGLVNTFVGRRTRNRSRQFTADPHLLAPQLVDFFYHGAHELTQGKE